VSDDSLKHIVEKAALEVAKAARKRQIEDPEGLEMAKLRDEIKRSRYLADLARGQAATAIRLRHARYKG